MVNIRGRLDRNLDMMQHCALICSLAGLSQVALSRLVVVSVARFKGPVLDTEAF